ncbi:hypothetical protein BDV39DRAFT_166729 [Aspergillus sergii]|uniref:Uncharacterized protein n=1 Tax=Aspergillus sergii TaxID=1034303 RepID=A0A5N6XHL9_9EURO|nr:hypothetical protein BDV39DRAFT_166729 [Aspergillus sergii]
MSDRKRISYTYESIEDFEENDGKVREIIAEDTGTKIWAYTKSLPPSSIPPPVTTGAVQKLKDLQGVLVYEHEDDE